MEHDTSRHESSLFQSHSQVTSRASASSDQSLGRVPHTAVNDGSANNVLAPANDPMAVEMEVLDDAPLQFHAQYSTELK